MRLGAVTNVCASYRVDFASGAWRQVGGLTRTAFTELRNALRDVAESAPREAATRESSEGLIRNQIRAGGVIATFDVDHTNSSVLVVEVQLHD
jgi:hypothetical protein